MNKFLEFKGHTMYYTLIDGEWWIALKPICEALNVDWNHQHRVVKNDEMMGPVSSNQTIQVRPDQARAMFCLPEFFIYGWLFQIRSDSKKLLAYKWECYRILFEHFNGTITRRKQVLQEIEQTDIEIRQLENEVQQLEAFKKIGELKKKRREMANVTLKKLDKYLLNGKQLELDLN